MIRTKICGITCLKELRIAEASGCDAIGFLVGQKHRASGFISAEFANELCHQTNPFISTVIVTHIEEANEIVNLLDIVDATTLQIHSDLPIDGLTFIQKNKKHIKIIGKVSITGRESIKRAIEIQEYVDALLLDTIDMENNRVGGTGKTHNWNISKEIVKISNKPVILAGGLNSDNIRQAIEIVKPWGVDCNTGVRNSNVLDNILVNDLIKKAKSII